MHTARRKWEWKDLYMWPLVFLISGGRVVLKCVDCGYRACPVMTFKDEEFPHIGRCGK